MSGHMRISSALAAPAMRAARRSAQHSVQRSRRLPLPFSFCFIASSFHVFRPPFRGLVPNFRASRNTPDLQVLFTPLGGRVQAVDTLDAAASVPVFQVNNAFKSRRRM